MFSELTAWIIEAIRAHGTLGVVLGVALEEIIVPIPSPVVIMAAGAILVEPNAGLQAALSTIVFTITIPAVIVSLLGSYIPFAVGYFGGRPLIERTEKWIGLSWDEVSAMQQRLIKKDRETYAVILFRALPIMPLSLVSGAAGLVRMDWKKYSIATLIGMVPRVLILSVLGWKIGELYMNTAMQFESVESFVSISIVALVLFALVAHKFKLLDRLKGLVT